MLFYYATRDGQSQRIAERIGKRLRERGVAATPEDLAVATPAAANLAQAPLLVLVAAIRYGWHLPEANRLLTIYRELQAPPPLVFASVSRTSTAVPIDARNDLWASPTATPSHDCSTFSHVRGPRHSGFGDRTSVSFRRDEILPRRLAARFCSSDV